MAYYAALVPLVQLLKDVTRRPHHEYLSSALDKQQIYVSLYEKFSHMQELLEDYSPKDLKKESADILEGRIRDAAHQVQDTIEPHISTTFPTHVHQENRNHGVERFFQHLVSAFGNFLDDIVEKEYYEGLEKMKSEADSIIEELMRIKESHAKEKDLQLNSYISADSVGEAPRGRDILVGFEEYLTKIKGQLCGQSSRLEVISIVGMGGLGKSTLARNIFDDKLIEDHFDCRAWVTVSQDYHLRDILRAIVDSLNIVIVNSLNMERRGLSEVKEEEEILGEHIYKHLFGRRYLIVLDDIWETKVWDDVKKSFPNDYSGSRVITTTRLLNVAVYADNSGFIHELQFLNEVQSWNLFCHKVLCPPELENLGRLIAKNCRGLPLAIIVVAGLLSKLNKTRHNWKEIARDVSSAATSQNDEHFSKILALSYNHLPLHLKPCFLYLGAFPEDYDIRVSMLIRLWVAEGFLKPVASKSLEEVGEEYFADLVNRNLVLVTKKRTDGKFKRCSIHDVLRDMCSARARDEKFFHRLHRKVDFHREPVGNVRRLYIQKWHHSLLGRYGKEPIPNVRTILVSSEYDFFSIATGCELWRVLDARRMNSSEFPIVIVKLFHLRYLSLGANNIRIPPSISRLQNLQSLILKHGETSLPSEIWNMPQLRHIMFRYITLAPIPYGKIRIIDGVPLLRSLQTLERVKDFKFTYDTIKMIPSLKKLKVECTCEAYKKWKEFGLSNLIHLPQLETLDIRFSGVTMVVTPLPDNFALPTTLIKLTLHHCQLPWKDMRVVGSLPNLQILKLREDAFVGEEWESIEGEFLMLKFLLIESLSDLKYWQAENTNFPRLEQLYIRNCNKLEEIPSEIGDISTLQLIEVYGARNSALKSSALKIQEEQWDQGNNDLQIRLVH